MRVKGMSGGQVLNILIDSGSTHNFLDIEMAKQLRCSLQSIPSQAVTVADGNHLACQHMCPGFSWKFQGHKFTTDAMLISLGSCDMVLGIQWLRTLGSINWDFNKLEMVFSIQGQKMVLKGQPQQRVKVLKGAPSEKLLKNAAQLCFLQLTEVTPLLSPTTDCKAELMTTLVEEPTEIQKLKQHYNSILEEPKNLPPHRGVFDHLYTFITRCWASKYLAL